MEVVSKDQVFARESIPGAGTVCATKPLPDGLRWDSSLGIVSDGDAERFRASLTPEEVAAHDLGVNREIVLVSAESIGLRLQKAIMPVTDGTHYPGMFIVMSRPSQTSDSNSSVLPNQMQAALSESGHPLGFYFEMPSVRE